MARLTINNVNKALAAAGIDAELVKGNGYFWFCGNEAVSWFTSSVYVPRLSDLPTVEAWVAEYQAMRAVNEPEPAQSQESPATLQGSAAVNAAADKVITLDSPRVEGLTQLVTRLKQRTYNKKSGLFVVYEQMSWHRSYMKGIDTTHQQHRTTDVLSALVCTENYAKLQARFDVHLQVVPIEQAIAEDITRFEREIEQVSNRG